MKKKNDYWNPPEFGPKKDNEVVCYGIGVGNLPLPPFMPKPVKEALAFIQGLDGFVDFYPCWPHGTVCVFRTLNEAKVAKNLMQAKGIKTGREIAEMFVEKQYVEGSEEK